MSEDRRPPRSAIALQYTGRGAPRLTAKGRGEVAEQIEALARTHGVAIHEDAALTQALSQIPLGEEIPENLYVAVAEVLAFVYWLGGRRPGDEKDQDRGEADAGEAEPGG
ncbi:EscU/YscU/HrcU family type III secretion system export apparatus switch protein [Ectothiorhodospira mobilis]|uniref:EscU/YscU/HrcU family type III secretion system export apparatus switch protein n=1 Tax=Ectothiorhodospira mobilis TaxID=195064 RepID=UPI001EE83345|nr:EscU/YscU/HrcU family type III secretion system export apparatus switch protein [Ectothiorhodospira mobilis]MCG5535033.1 EscU/YscU/HrcU family type III secretion system export apparatus switch protein [Ectothiorhodospira mobilis]